MRFAVEGNIKLNLLSCLLGCHPIQAIGLLALVKSYFTIVNSIFYCLPRACLVATIRSSGASQSTIKLVATNLIASGKLKG